MKLSLHTAGHDLELSPANGFHVSDLDLGFPEVRSVLDPRTDRSGATDRTRFHGARVVTVQMMLNDRVGQDRMVLLERLAPYCRPSVRPVLRMVRPDGTQRQVVLRADARSAPLSAPNNLLAVQLQWVAPSGVIEATSVTTKVALASSDSEIGREYDLDFDRGYPAASPVGAVLIENPGGTESFPTLRMYGPCETPRIENQTSGGRLQVDVTVSAGTYLEVDVAERTVRLNGSPSQSRYQAVDWTATSSWDALTVPPGASQWRFFPVTSNTPSQANIRFRSAWL
jgi:hypothetical protein